MKLHHISKDVSEAKYCEMIRRLLEMSSSFSLVLRVDMGFKPDSNRIVQALAGIELRRERADRWPGTVTFAREKPLVAHFRSSPDALEPLCRPGRLFSWLAPAYPEDPAFYDRAGTALFATTAHESESWALHRKVVRALADLVRFEIEDVPDDAVRIIRGAAV
jgi:hypothetical protein